MRNPSLGVYMRVDDGPDVMIGEASSVAAVPDLLRAVAAEWAIKLSNDIYFAADDANSCSLCDDCQPV